jgi:hypothetical protein
VFFWFARRHESTRIAGQMFVHREAGKREGERERGRGGGRKALHNAAGLRARAHSSSPCRHHPCMLTPEILSRNPTPLPRNPTPKSNTRHRPETREPRHCMEATNVKPNHTEVRDYLNRTPQPLTKLWCRITGRERVQGFRYKP